MGVILGIILNDGNLASQENHIMNSIINTRNKWSELKVLQKVVNDFSLQMAQVEGQIVFVKEHLVQLEHVLLPKILFELWEHIHYFLNA